MNRNFLFHDSLTVPLWCRQGKTGIIGLILCLYWQDTFSGAGNDWKANMQRVENIFNAILAGPEL